MLLLIPATIMALAGIVMMFAKTSDGSRHPGAGVGLLCAAILAVAVSCVTVVGTRNVGVVTTFGKPSGRTLGNGLHFKAPWQKVTDIDGTITTQKFVGEEGCIGVRISDGSTACVSLVIRSRINPDAADDLFADYRNSDKDINDQVNDALVRTQLTSALASTFADFNPLLVPGSVESSTSTEQSAPDLQGFSSDVTSKMDALLRKVAADDKPQVEVKSITISYIRLASSTQDRLNQLQAEVAKTRIAKQAEATAQAQAEANKALSASISNDPNVLVAKCFDSLAAMVETKQAVPAGFSCWPGSNGAVVVPSGK